MEGGSSAFPPSEPEPRTQSQRHTWLASQSVQEAKLQVQSKWLSLEVSKFVIKTLWWTCPSPRVTGKASGTAGVVLHRHVLLEGTVDVPFPASIVRSPFPWLKSAKDYFEPSRWQKEQQLAFLKKTEAVQGSTLLESQNLREAGEEDDLRSSRAGRGNASRPCLRSTTKPKQQKEANFAVALWTSK